MVFRIGTTDADDPNKDSIQIKDKDMLVSDIGMLPPLGQSAFESDLSVVWCCIVGCAHQPPVSGGMQGRGERNTRLAVSKNSRRCACFRYSKQFHLVDFYA